MIRFLALALTAFGLSTIAFTPSAMADGHGMKHHKSEMPQSEVMVTAGDLTIAAAFARATPGMSKNGAAFMTIKNAGAADRLVSASTDVSERVELHRHTHDNGVMRMREVEAIEVGADGETVLKPGGLHVMLMGLKAPLTEGESFSLTLTFDKAGDVSLTVPIKKVGAMGGHKNH